MKISNRIIKKGFILAGLMNASVLIFSRFFTNKTIALFDPAIMSNFGLFMIVLWGLAYIAISNNFHRLRLLIGIFAIEKLAYAIAWVNWLSSNDVADVYSKDTFAGIFYSIYGINDGIFFVFFSFVFIRLTIHGNVN